MKTVRYAIGTAAGLVPVLGMMPAATHAAARPVSGLRQASKSSKIVAPLFQTAATCAGSKHTSKMNSAMELSYFYTPVQETCIEPSMATPSPMPTPSAARLNGNGK